MCAPDLPSSFDVLIEGWQPDGTDPGDDGTECCPAIDGEYNLAFVSGHVWRQEVNPYCQGYRLVIWAEIRFDTEEECVFELHIEVYDGETLILEHTQSDQYNCGEADISTYVNKLLTCGPFSGSGTAIVCADACASVTVRVTANA